MEMWRVGLPPGYLANFPPQTLNVSAQEYTFWLPNVQAKALLKEENGIWEKGSGKGRTPQTLNKVWPADYFQAEFNLFFPSGACHSGCQKPHHFHCLPYVAVSNTYVTSLTPEIHRKLWEPWETDPPRQPCWRIPKNWQKRQGVWVVETMMSLGGKLELLIDGT